MRGVVGVAVRGEGHATAPRGGHALQDADRLATMRARHGATGVPDEVHFVRRLCPRNAECDSTVGRRWMIGTPREPAGTGDGRRSASPADDLRAARYGHPVHRGGMRSDTLAIMTVTRRFLARPSGLSAPSAFVLGAAGRAAPKPSTFSFSIDSPPSFTSHVRTASARCNDSRRL
jgi:hypothetical protein